jgi:hypothetical protein
MQAKAPFEFFAASYLVQIRTERSHTLGELVEHLRNVSEASIFYHTYQSLETHHYALFSNDFAQWSMAACNEAVLAEQLGSIDLRDFLSIADLREALASTVDRHLRRHPPSADRLAFEPFYFCEAEEITVPLDEAAHTLAELAGGIRGMSLQTLHHHFISSRLRLQLRTNDFSNWIRDSLELPDLADRLNRVDFYTNTLEGVRKDILQTIEPGMQL